MKDVLFFLYLIFFLRWLFVYMQTVNFCILIVPHFFIGRACLVAQRLKRLPAMWETWVRSPGWEDPLGKEMAIRSSILAWRIPWTEEPGGLH